MAKEYYMRWDKGENAYVLDRGIKDLAKTVLRKARNGFLKTVFAISTAYMLTDCPTSVDPEPDPDPKPKSSSSSSSSSSTAYSSSSSSSSSSSIPSYRTVSGRLESNEEDGVLKPGLVRVYNANTNELLGEDTDGGEFTIQVPYLTDIKVKGQIKDGSGNCKSYIRIKNLEGLVSNISDVKIACVPYPDFDTNFDGVINEIDYTNFKKHAEETNMSTAIRSDNKEEGMNKSTPRNVEILREYPGDSSKGNFCEENQNLISSKTTALDDIRAFVNGQNLNVQIDGAGNYHANGNHYVITNGIITDVVPEWIIVVPQAGLGGGKAGGGYLNDDSLTRIIDRASIYLDPIVVNELNPVTSHEFGHALYALNHASTLSAYHTIMKASGNILTKPGVADIKMGKIVTQDSYEPGETSDDVLSIGEL